MLSHVIAVDEKLQIMLMSQASHKLLIRVGFRPPQAVIEMDDRKNNPKFTAQFEQQPQKRDRINSARNGHTHAVPGPQQFLPPDVGKHALGQ